METEEPRGSIGEPQYVDFKKKDGSIVRRRMWPLLDEHGGWIVWLDPDAMAREITNGRTEASELETAVRAHLEHTPECITAMAANGFVCECENTEQLERVCAALADLSIAREKTCTYADLSFEERTGVRS